MENKENTLSSSSSLSSSFNQNIMKQTSISSFFQKKSISNQSNQNDIEKNDMISNLKIKDDDNDIKKKESGSSNNKDIVMDNKDKMDTENQDDHDLNNDNDNDNESIDYKPEDNSLDDSSMQSDDSDEMVIKKKRKLNSKKTNNKKIDKILGKDSNNIKTNKKNKIEVENCPLIDKSLDDIYKEKLKDTKSVDNNLEKGTDLLNNFDIELIDSADIHDEKWIWNNNEPVPYSALCSLFEKVEATTKRLEILAYVTSFLKLVILRSPDCFIHCVYLCINRIAPEYDGKELGIGESLLIKAIATSTGRSIKAIKDDLNKYGDLGLVAQKSKGRQMILGTPKPLTVPIVFKILTEIANVTGNNSQQVKVGKINKLLVSCKGVEPKYLIRSLEGKLRIGLAEQSILHSIGQSTALITGSKIDIDNYKKIKNQEIKDEIIQKSIIDVKRVFSEIPNYDIVLSNILKYGVKNIRKYCKLQPGIPLKPMLAHPTKSITEVLDRFDGLDFTCEFKYDGERAQIHLIPNEDLNNKNKFNIKIYSRNLESLSEKYPDVIDIIKENINQHFNETQFLTKSFIIDCEVVAWDRIKNCILPFQVLSTRKRKGVLTEDVQVQVCLFAFDILYLNEEPLTEKSFKYRKEKLYSAFREIEGKFQFAKHVECSEIDEIQSFLDQSIEGNCEGLMVKTLDGKDSTYEPSKRSHNWLKVKKDYLSGVGDTFDLVVIGAYIGRGKRTGWYGGFLLACYNNDTEEYETICKIGTGFSEENLEFFYNKLKDETLDVAPSYYSYTENLKPDVWFEPKLVWEVKAADLSISPVYKAAIGNVNSNKGISLRFPRFIRIRDDKKPEQSTSSEQIAEFYLSQKQNTTNTLVDNFDDDY